MNSMPLDERHHAMEQAKARDNACCSAVSFAALGVAFLVFGTTVTCDFHEIESPAIGVPVTQVGVFRESRAMDNYAHNCNDFQQPNFDALVAFVKQNGTVPTCDGDDDAPYGEPSYQQLAGFDRSKCVSIHSNDDGYGNMWRLSRIFAIIAFGLAASTITIQTLLWVFYRHFPVTRLFAALYYLIALASCLILVGLHSDVCGHVLDAEEDYWEKGEAFLEVVRDVGSVDRESFETMQDQFQNWQERLALASCHHGKASISLIDIAILLFVLAGSAVLVGYSEEGAHRVGPDEHHATEQSGGIKHGVRLVSWEHDECP